MAANKDITPHVDAVFKPAQPRRIVTALAIRQVLLMCPDDLGVHVLADMALQAVEERDTERGFKHAALDIAHRVSAHNDRLESERLDRLRAGQ